MHRVIVVAVHYMELFESEETKSHAKISHSKSIPGKTDYGEQPARNVPLNRPCKF